MLLFVKRVFRASALIILTLTFRGVVFGRINLMKKMLFVLIFGTTPVFADVLSGEYLEGMWCEYAVSMKIGGTLDESSPVEWVFHKGGNMKYSGAPTTYSLEENTIIPKNALLGNWSLYEKKGASMILEGQFGGFAYYKRGECVLSKEAQMKKDIIVFHNAILLGKIDVVKKYLDEGMDPNVKNVESSFESASLHAAVKSRNLEIVKLLIKNGANVNITDFMGNTPLDIAKKEKQNEIINFLLENGANTSLKD